MAIQVTKASIKALTRDDNAPVRVTKARLAALVPVAVPDPSIELDHIASTATLYSPSLSIQVHLPQIASTLALYAPELLGSIGLGTVASTLVMYPPQLTVAVHLPQIASTGQVFSPGLNIFPIELGTIASTATLYQPVLQIAVQPEFIQSGATLYEPTVSSAVVLGHITSTAVTHPPIPVLSVILPRIESTLTMHDPVPQVTIALGHIASTATLSPFVFVLGEAAHVSGTLRQSGGYELFNGTVTITSPKLTFGSITYLPGSTVVKVVDGVFNTDLVPNTGAFPTGTKYRVVFQPKRGSGQAVAPWVEEWTVGATGFLDLNDVRP